MLNTPLQVIRTLSDGKRVGVGTLAENKSGVYFQYHKDYLEQHKTSLSPFNLKATTELQKAPRQPHYGLHGVFADSLPDGWGLYLMDRVFRINGYNPQKISALERLAVISSDCLGALSYEPKTRLREGSSDDIALRRLGQEAIKEFEGNETDLIEHLQAAGGSGGARPKLNATLLVNGQYSTEPNAKGKKLIVKLTSERFLLKHEESLVEYLYLTMAKNVGIQVPEFELIDAGNGQFWLQQARFDCSENGRYHMLSAAGLLDASFRGPSLDYVDLIKATRLMCGVDEAQKLVKRALFNYVTVNQDDHSKNFSFLANDKDEWQLSPCYDIVYSPSSYGEHMTAFNGNGACPDKTALEQMAGQAGFANSKPLFHMLDEIYQQIRNFKTEAKALGVSVGLIKTIENDIAVRARNVHLNV